MTSRFTGITWKFRKQDTCTTDKNSCISHQRINAESMLRIEGYAWAQSVEALYYKSEGRGFDSRWYHWNFSFPMVLGMTKPLTEMSTRDNSWGVKAAGS
jgi:hypothetical protein